MALVPTRLAFRSMVEQKPRKKWGYYHGGNMNPQNMSIIELEIRCAQELSHFLNDRYSDSRYGYELFRRALHKKDQFAWRSIMNVYNQMVLKWVRQHPKFALVKEEDKYFANRAFERLWRSIALKEGKFLNFTNLAKLLQFLKMCVNAAIIDDGLRLPPTGVTVDTIAEQDKQSSSHFQIEIDLTKQLNASYFWKLIEAKLRNKKEKIVIYASFLYDMKPREIYDHYSDLFDHAKQVGNIKANVLRRLARIPSFEETLRDFIDDGI